MVSRIVEESQTVIAQNYALGVNALGFLIYPLINRSVRERNKTILIFSLSFLSIICIFLIQQHISFSVTLAAGVVLFLLLGVFGGSVHYLAACTIRTERIAGLVGISYAAGILLQYANNNLVNIEIAEAAVLSVSLAVLSVLIMRTRRIHKEALASDETAPLRTALRPDEMSRKKIPAGLLLVLLVALMACVFSTLDNAITLGHAAGTMDIGQWPRMLLALRWWRSSLRSV